MIDPTPKPRRKGVSLGETIAILALLISAAGLYNSWQSKQDGPTEVLERKPAVPLVLRGMVEDGGKTLVISPAETAHVLDSLTLTLSNGAKIDAGSDGRIGSREFDKALGDSINRKADGNAHATVEARYVETGTERKASRRYAIRYRWEGGGLFDDRELRFVGFSRG